LGRKVKEKRVLEEVRQFQQLKAKIVASSSPYLPSGVQNPVKSAEMPGIDAVIRAIDELKSLMARELGAIREELGKLRKK
jgi:hypothetical protein